MSITSFPVSEFNSSEVTLFFCKNGAACTTNMQSVTYIDLITATLSLAAAIIGLIALLNLKSLTGRRAEASFAFYARLRAILFDLRAHLFEPMNIDSDAFVPKDEAILTKDYGGLSPNTPTILLEFIVDSNHTPTDEKNEFLESLMRALLFFETVDGQVPAKEKERWNENTKVLINFIVKRISPTRTNMYPGDTSAENDLKDIGIAIQTLLFLLEKEIDKSLR